MATFVGILDGSAESVSAPRLTDEQQTEFMVAASFEDAVGLVRGNPHLSLMDGNSIDLSECADLP